MRGGVDQHLQLLLQLLLQLVVRSGVVERLDDETTTGGARSRVPLTIIGGFLGSGKTTTLNHLLTNADGRRFAVIVNDFGAINIDAKLVVSVEGERIALSNGCVCCVIRDDLVAAVAKLCLEDAPPDHIIIETSGVSRPVAVVDSFFRPEIGGLVEVRNIITLLDADQVADQVAGQARGGTLAEARDYADLAFAQIAVADIVVINKIDLAPADALRAIRAKVESIVPRARIIETRHGALPIAMLFDDDDRPRAAAAMARRLGDGGARTALKGLDREANFDAPRHAFATWSFRDPDRAYPLDALRRLVEAIPRGIYRAKGLIRLDLDSGDHGVLQVTGRRGSLRLVSPPTPQASPVDTEVVFIGEPDALDPEMLGGLFDIAWRDTRDPSAPSRIVADLRAFRVEFV